MNLSFELLTALRTLDEESIGDFVYTIRDREGLGWDGPRVVAWDHAAQIIKKVVAEANAGQPE